MSIYRSATLVWLVLSFSIGTSSVAADSEPTEELHELVIDLKQLPVTSVSKRETKLVDAATAIAVVTAEDIRRLGITTLPEALRLVPGMDVARINANEWAVASRGFNLQYSAKLLVLIDGRSIYTPTSAGVWWNDQNLPMADIERIEVIRGPGATLWGANAVNGIINIITRKAQDTQGWLTSASFGNEERAGVEAQYGGKLGERAFYRAYLKHFDRDNFVDPSGDDMVDDWSGSGGGVRVDWQSASADTFTLLGDYHTSTIRQPWLRPVFGPPYAEQISPANHNFGGNALLRWTRERSADSSFTLQLYYDRFRHVDAGTAESRNTYDIDWQYRFALDSQQTFTWGADYRYTVDDLSPIFFMTYVPARRRQPLYSAFVQDEIAFSQKRVMLTLGSKFEHHDFVGWQIQPNVRMLWQATHQQTVWVAASRAVRTPSRYERDTIQNVGVAPPDSANPLTIYRVVGGRDSLDAEEVKAYEMGYRVNPHPTLSLDLAAYYNIYENLIGTAPGASFLESTPAPEHLVVPYLLQNNGHGHTYGAELSAQWSPNDAWRLATSYTTLYMSLKPNDVYLSSGDSPQQQFQLRSYLNLPHHLELNAAVYYVDELPNQHADSYVRADAGLVWHRTRSFEIGAWGTNLLDQRHYEFGTYSTPLRTEVPRTFMARILWSY